MSFKSYTYVKFNEILFPWVDSWTFKNFYVEATEVKQKALASQVKPRWCHVIVMLVESGA